MWSCALRFTHLFGPQEPLTHQGMVPLCSRPWDTVELWELTWPARQEASGQIKARDQPPGPLSEFFHVENEGSFSNNFTMERVLGEFSISVQL